jgi:hypothetical protein
MSLRTHATSTGGDDPAGVADADEGVGEGVTVVAGAPHATAERLPASTAIAAPNPIDP